jgi:hypothetical protein
MSDDIDDILPPAAKQRTDLLAKLEKMLGQNVESDVLGIVVTQTVVVHPANARMQFRIMVIDPPTLRLMSQLIYVEEQIVIEAARAALDVEAKGGAHSTT